MLHVYGLHIHAKWKKIKFTDGTIKNALSHMPCGMKDISATYIFVCSCSNASRNC